MAAGGDKQSAALKVFGKEAYAWLDLRVDAHAHPVSELRRVFEIAKQQLLPFIDGMPSRHDPLGDIPADVSAMIMTPPQHRPGGNA